MKQLELLGNRLKHARLMKDVCQEYIATQLNISQAAYSKMENGQTQISVIRLLEICRILNVNAKDMLEEFGEEVPIVQ